jgi:hypothetical protein
MAAIRLKRKANLVLRLRYLSLRMRNIFSWRKICSIKICFRTNATFRSGSRIDMTQNIMGTHRKLIPRAPFKEIMSLFVVAHFLLVVTMGYALRIVKNYLLIIQVITLAFVVPWMQLHKPVTVTLKVTVTFYFFTGLAISSFTA